MNRRISNDLTRTNPFKPALRPSAPLGWELYDEISSCLFGDFYLTAIVARMSAATCGEIAPGYRFAHPGYRVHSSLISAAAAATIARPNRSGQARIRM